MNIIVTGGAGFIGSNFIRYMLNKYPSYNIFCIDKLTYAGHLFTLQDVFDNPHFYFFYCDICNRPEIQSLFKQILPDIVINFAAESHVDNSIANSYPFIMSNVVGVQVLLECCRENNIRFYQISTDEVYGCTELDSTYSFLETDKLNPRSPYAASKANADLLVLSYFYTYNLPITISRCTNNFGPYQLPEKLIPKMILTNDDFTIYGQGLNIRDWIYVDDHSKAIDLIIHHGIPGEIYNIGAHQEYTNNQVINVIQQCDIDLANKKIRYVQDRPGHDLRYSLNTTKIEKLGWQPMIDFQDGIKTTIDWYKNNMNWVNNL